MPTEQRDRITRKLWGLQNGLTGDVSRLRNTFPDFRPRAGDYRALFAIEAGCVVVYRVRHRREVYR